MFCCVRLKILMQGSLHFLRGNFCPASNSSSLQQFLNETLHQVDSTEKKIRQDNYYVPFLGYYLNTVVHVHISSTEIEGK
jgi:hypothetical protein